jgi:hypothetical protein
MNDLINGYLVISLVLGALFYVFRPEFVAYYKDGKIFYTLWSRHRKKETLVDGEKIVTDRFIRLEFTPNVINEGEWSFSPRRPHYSVCLSLAFIHCYLGYKPISIR